jgi:hypothetical protein
VDCSDDSDEKDCPGGGTNLTGRENYKILPGLNYFA